MAPQKFLYSLKMNSLATGRRGYNFKCIDFEHNLWIGILDIQVNIVVARVAEDLVDNKSGKCLVNDSLRTIFGKIPKVCIMEFLWEMLFFYAMNRQVSHIFLTIESVPKLRNFGLNGFGL